VPKRVARKDSSGKQIEFDDVAISPDRRVVGWLALYANCCTSYPIPLALVLYSNGKTRVLTGRGLPVWQWRFLANGTRVAFEQETVHGGIGVHFELRDVVTGRLIDEYDPPSDSSADAAATPPEPPIWVTEMSRAK
jgi:hypothetical protein